MPSTSRAPPSATSLALSRRAGRWRSTARPPPPVEIIEAARALAAPFGIGRGIHLGDTIIGTKGRVAFEAPAAEVLLTAHRELEKLVLTGAPAAHQGTGRAALRRPGARGPAARPGVPRHRGAAAVLAGARDRRCARAAADRQPVHRGRRVAVLAHGRLARACTARRPGEWTASRCARLLEDRLAARACSTPAPASGAAPRRPRSSHGRDAQRGGRQARLGDAGLRPVARGARRRARSPPRRAWSSWSRC